MGDHALFSVKNNQNRASFFPGKERGDRALILPYLDSPIAKVFSWKILIFYFGHFRRKWAGQSWTKSANFGYVPFPKKLAFFEDSWKTAFLSLALPLVKISAKSDNIWESKGPKNPKRGPFHGCVKNHSKWAQNDRFWGYDNILRSVKWNLQMVY